MSRKSRGTEVASGLVAAEGKGEEESRGQRQGTGYGVSLYGDKNVLKLTVVMIAWICKHTKNQ